MNFASNYAYIGNINSKEKQQSKESNKMMSTDGNPYLARNSDSEDEKLNLNVFVLTFQGVKNAEKLLSGGDPYSCKKCAAILNKNSKVLWQQELQKSQNLQKIELTKSEALWECEFCYFKNIIKIEREEVPLKQDVVYMLQSENMGKKNQNDSTIVFCIDTSGSMNSTSIIEGKVQLKYGISQQEIQMLRQFMQPGDEAQLNYLPGAQNHNKTFVSRKQCIFSAIQSQINEIKKEYPFKKIGFVTFGSEVVVLGDTKCQTLNLVGDKLYSHEAIINSLTNFKLNDPIVEAHATLLNNINKTEAKGLTALGPALISALEIAGKGSPGSSVILCTDGLANIGVGQLQPYDEQKIKFYSQLGDWAKSKNISVSIITIKGEGCKIQAIGKLAQKTNGNIKIVNPEKLSDDFANVLKDEVVGLNVLVRILLHQGMSFRNEAVQNLKEGGCVLLRELANATKNTRISFEYDVRSDEELQKLKIDFRNLKKVPFQAQIEYTSPTGGKFLRVVSNMINTTESKEVMSKQANLGVVHQRITNQTAALYKGGDYKGSKNFNRRWQNYLNKNFKEEEKQAKFIEKNQRLNKAIKHRHKKSIEKKRQKKEELSEQQLEIINNHSQIQSDEDQRQLVDNLMERQCYSISKSFHSSSGSKGKQEKEEKKGKKDKKEEKRERRKSIQKKEKETTPVKQRRRSIKRKESFHSDSD